MGTGFKSGKFSRFKKIGSSLLKASGQLALERAKDTANNLISKSESLQNYQHRVNAAAEIIKTMGELKGGLMKLGQMLSITEDLVLPPEISAMFKELQKSSPPMSDEDLNKVFRESFDKRPEDIFASFERTPMAAASIGQVHKAVLPTGETVAVKVQYPMIVDAIRNDFKNLDQLTSLLTSLIPGKPDIDHMVEEMKRSVLEECHYTRELDNLEFFRKAYAEHFPRVLVPRGYSEFSSDTVLTMEYMQGDTYEQTGSYTQQQKNDIGQLLYDSYLYSFFYLRRFHTDPQNGNYLFQRDKIIMLDFGSTRELDEEFMVTFVSMLLSLEEDRFDAYVHIMNELGFFLPNESEEIQREHFSLVKKLYLPFCGPGAYHAEVGNPFELIGEFMKGIKLAGRKAPREEFLLVDRANLGLFTKLRYWKSAVDWQQNKAQWRDPWVERARQQHPNLFG